MLAYQWGWEKELATESEEVWLLGDISTPLAVSFVIYIYPLRSPPPRLRFRPTGLPKPRRNTMPSCFRGGPAAGPSASSSERPTLTTSVYETPLGLASLTWSRTLLGLSLRTVLRLDEVDVDDENDEEGGEPLRFCVRPWLLWKRRGARRFHFKDRVGRRRSVDIAWDLTRATFPSGPEPAAGFFVAMSVDADLILVAGDLIDEVHKKTKAQRPPASSALISRLEHVVLVENGGSRRSYRSRARLGGRDREIFIDIGAKEKGKEFAMSVEVDGKRVVNVRRLRWKFRGSERVELDGGRIQFSWDLHNWFFHTNNNPSVPKTSCGDVSASVASELGHAVFVLRFENKENPSQGRSGNPLYKNLAADRYNAKTKNINRSCSSSGGSGGEKVKSGRKRSTQKRSCSASSTSSASSASTWSVMDWASEEEMELRRSQGFSLLVYAWKN